MGSRMVQGGERGGVGWGAVQNELVNNLGTFATIRVLVLA